ncbi:MAG: hypothetical protein AAGI44_05905 [Pseudomonadota bacterium]
MVSQADRISKAIAWYEANREEIAAALPLTHQGTTWTPAVLNFQDDAIAKYRDGEIGKKLAEVYVLNSIRRLYRAFERSKKEVKSGE